MPLCNLRLYKPHTNGKGFVIRRPSETPYLCHRNTTKRTMIHASLFSGIGGSVHAREVGGEEGATHHACAAELAGLGERRRWEGFPNVAPLVRGNDGLPFDVDGLTLSANQWRVESIRATGNAIVPQVMYELFLHIEAVEMYYHMLPTENIRTRVK